MKKKEVTNVIRFKKPFQFNIGAIIFCFLLVYLVIIGVSYALKGHIASYEVQLGALASNNTYRALAVRNEAIVNADRDGYITYFAKECSKVSAKTLVYAVSNQPNYYDEMLSASDGDTRNYSAEDLESIGAFMDDFYYTYQNDAFFHAYSFESSLDGNLLNALMSEEQEGSIQQGMSAYYGGTPGIVVYSIDGLETVTTENFTDDEINALNYSAANLTMNERVTAGSPAYKVITDENWSLIIEVDQSLIETLSGEEYVRIRFTDDDISCYASFHSQVKNGKYYLIMNLSNHLIRYANRRYIDIEVITEVAKGYKIPTTCIDEMEFVKVPTGYETQGGNSSKTGLLKEEKDEDGKKITVFHSVDFYKEKDGYYYILDESFKKGDRIIIPSSGETYVLNETEKLEGVYSINKGYAVFRLVEILYRNEDYCIIRTNTPYGVSNYDHIVLEGSEVENGQMIN